MGKILGGVAVVAGLSAIAKHTISVASNLEEAENKLKAVFGVKGQSLVNDFATRYRDDLGMSILETKNFIADAGNLFTGFGMGEEKARTFSTEVLKLTNDLASFNNLKTEDAQRRMMSALMGESEAAKGLGASILETQLKVASADMGLGKYSSSMDELTKIQIRYHAIMMQSGKAIGDSERSIDSYVAKKRRLMTVLERISLAFGEKFLPAVTATVSALGTLLIMIADNMEVITALAVAVGAGATAYGVYMLVLNRVAIATKIATIAQSAFNLAMRLNPIGIIVTAVGALIGWLVYLYNTNEKVRYIFIAGWEDMKNAVRAFINVFIKQINFLLNVYNSIAEAVGKKPIKLIAEFGVKGLGELNKIAKAKSLIAKAEGAINPASGLGGSTATSSGGIGTAGAGTGGGSAPDGESYFKTFSNGDSSTSKRGGNNMTVGDITIHVTQKDSEDSDALIDRLTYRIANEFNKAGKIAGII